MPPDGGETEQPKIFAGKKLSIMAFRMAWKAPRKVESVSNCIMSHYNDSLIIIDD